LFHLQRVIHELFQAIINHPVLLTASVSKSAHVSVICLDGDWDLIWEVHDSGMLIYDLKKSAGSKIADGTDGIPSLEVP
jgi:hypothetical protein